MVVIRGMDVVKSMFMIFCHGYDLGYGFLNIETVLVMTKGDGYEYG